PTHIYTLSLHGSLPIYPRTFIGAGKLAELKEALQVHAAELVIFNHALSPSQERNLERALECRVLDRTGLILDIFAQRARTHEGKDRKSTRLNSSHVSIS